MADEFEVRATGQFCQVLDVQAESGIIDHFTQRLKVTPAFAPQLPPELEEFVVGHSAEYREILQAEGRPQPPEVDSMALLGEEIVRIVAVGEDYIDIARGCADTIPAQHGASAKLYVFEDYLGTDAVEYAGGESIEVKVLPKTASDVLPIDQAPAQLLTFDWRFARPYPPGQMQQNGEPWFTPSLMTADEPYLTLTWVHRNRVVQADRLVDHFEESVSPEAGTTYWVEVYAEGEDEPRRTELGLTGTSWTYTWSQAIVDLDIVITPEDEDPKLANAIIRFGSMRDGLRSWQAYELPFQVNNEGVFLRAAHLSTVTLQETEFETDPMTGVSVGTLGMQTTQETGMVDGPLVGVFVSQLTAASSQETSLFIPMSRVIFEAPYTFTLRSEGSDPATARVVSAAGRPEDRLTDYRLLYSRLKPESGGAGLPYQMRVRGGFTPWAVTGNNLDYLDTQVQITRTSLTDGVPLDNVQVGQMALIGAEFVRIDAIEGDTLTIGRGCVDTTPRSYNRGQRIWFVEAGSLVDTTPWPRPSEGYTNLEYKVVPEVTGVPLELERIATDALALDQRKWRPFPPGRVTLNGQPWFKGAQATPGQNIEIRWAHRNRLTQGVDIIDHTHTSIAPEAGTQYRLSITVTVPPRTAGGKAYSVLIREAWVEGTAFDYTYEMAHTDGYRVARLLGVCGAVSVQMRLDAYRDGLDNWQGYSFYLRLPAPACPTTGGNYGGGSGGGQQPGRGNGDNGNTPGQPPPPPQTEDPDDPQDPLDPVNPPPDDGPLPPDPPPPDWPDDVEEPPTEWPGGEDDEGTGTGRWDMNWDQFWAARADDDPGDDEGDD